MNQEVSISEIERILLEDPHITAIHKDEWDIPEIDYSNWAMGDSKYAQGSSDILKRYLGMPYIEDDFDNHELRREWRTELEHKYSWFKDYYEANSIRSAKLGAVSITLEALEDDYIYIGNNPEEFYKAIKQARELCKTIKKQDSTTPDRIKQIKELKKSVYNVLEVLAK